MRTLVALLFLATSGLTLAGDYTLPTSEQAFLDEIPTVDKTVILELLGDPSRTTDILDRDTGEIVGVVWQYHYVNTSADGDYYKTTELDFVGDHVVTVVFSNNDYDDDVMNSALEAEHSETF